MIAIRLAATELPRRGSLLDDVHDSSVAADGHSIVDSWNAHTTDHAQFAAALTIRFLMSPPPPSATILSNVTCTAARSSGGRPRRCLERLGTPFDDQIKGFCRARATNNCTWQSEEAASRTVVPRPRRSFMTRTRHRLSVDTSRQRWIGLSRWEQPLHHPLQWQSAPSWCMCPKGWKCVTEPEARVMKPG